MRKYLKQSNFFTALHVRYLIHRLQNLLTINYMPCIVYTVYPQSHIIHKHALYSVYSIPPYYTIHALYSIYIRHIIHIHALYSIYGIYAILYIYVTIIFGFIIEFLVLRD